MGIVGNLLPKTTALEGIERVTTVLLEMMALSPIFTPLSIRTLDPIITFSPISTVLAVGSVCKCRSG